MARISTYSVDNTLQKNDLLLGSNANGRTRNFTFEDVTTYLMSVGISGKFVLQYVNTSFNGYSTQQKGQFTVPGSSANTYNFSDSVTFKISEFPFGAEKLSALERIQQFKNETVIIANINDINQFGLFNITNIQQDSSDNTLWDITLTASYGQSLISNGILENLKYYTFEVYKSDKRFVHHQNSPSTTWSINHNLGKFPNVTVKFSSGATYTNVGAFAGVQFTDENNLTINLRAAESGYAYLN